MTGLAMAAARHCPGGLRGPARTSGSGMPTMAPPEVTERAA